MPLGAGLCVHTAAAVVSWGLLRRACLGLCSSSTAALNKLCSILLCFLFFKKEFSSSWPDPVSHSFSYSKGQPQCLTNVWQTITELVLASQVVLVVKNLLANADRYKRCWFDPWVRKIPWGRARQPTPVYLPGEPMGRGAWQAAVHRVAQSRTRLKPLSTL